MTPQSGSPHGRLPVKQLLLVLGVAATLYAAALLFWGGSPASALAAIGSWAGLQAAALCLLNYLLRGMRWRMWMVHYGRTLPWPQALRLYLCGYAFTPTPANVGEAVRGMMLAHEPMKPAQSLAIFGAERIADLVCLLLLCLPVAGWVLRQGLVHFSSSAAIVAGVVAALLLVAAGVAVMVMRAQLSRRLGWLREAWLCLAVRPWAWLALTLTAWMAQGIAVWLICREVGIGLDRVAAGGFYALAMVAGALSALPAGLGSMEAVLTGLLVAAGGTAAQAVAATVAVRLLTLWLAVAIGVAALLYSAAITREISFR